MVFEDPALGAFVHRGIYSAAHHIYDDVLPLVRQHLAAHPADGAFAFGGHSLGGGLATVVMLLLVARGEVPASALAPSCVFGAPAVFCAGSTPGQRPALLEALGIAEDKLVNVIMHRDIVPRAFVCDYTALVGA